ncbi:MAG: hypothetical protein JSS86_25435 [Cyanobacteria bacterium SZAS LIN-2]|nr:hypothetical protein [Cyanobacteria bacterium SZAS LIN-2]
MSVEQKLIDTLKHFDVSTLEVDARDRKHEELRLALKRPATIGEVWDDLYTIAAEFRSLTRQEQEVVLPDMFDFLERAGDLDIGTPGPIVHSIEATADLYLPCLEESILRKPTPVTVWMVNRILNDEIDFDAADRYKALLRQVLSHPQASEIAKEAALGFLEYQDSVQ